MDASQFSLRMKHFVKSSKETSTSTDLKTELIQTPRAAFSSGSDIKRFYENTVGKEAFDKTCKTNDSRGVERQVTRESDKRSNITRPVIPFNVNFLMKAVEDGNFKEVERILSGREESVNCKDQFGWTPVMSACCAGSESMVELLLKFKPDLSFRDKKGNSCDDLARAKGHTNILDILHSYKRQLNRSVHDRPELLLTKSHTTRTFYCKDCKKTIENVPYKTHLLSTVHNFNLASMRKMPTLYGIPESNKGFQILVKSGWDKETGLGPSGEGHKFPPKTILKQDRTGLGAKKYKPKVTHNLEDARKEATPKNTFKRQLRSDKRKEQRLERNLRRMLS